LLVTVLVYSVNMPIKLIICRFDILRGCAYECSVSDSTVRTCGNGWTVHEHCWWVLLMKILGFVCNAVWSCSTTCSF